MDKKSIIDAFCDEDFQRRVIEASGKIKKILEEFISEETINYKNSHKINPNINIRIKGVNSFSEKLDRNNYINEWISENNEKIAIQNTICEKLPDLIGLRINCYFIASEKTLFEDLRKFLQRKNIESESNPNTEQKNHKYIAKIACKYIDGNNIYPFEVQIKSYLNDVWGEVEHDIIYKSKVYNPRESIQKEIITSASSILEGIDNELKVLFNEKIELLHIKNELFFYLTYNIVFEKESINLGKYYSVFFELFKLFPNYQDTINQFLGLKILGGTYTKLKLDTYKSEFYELLEKDLDQYIWNNVCKIFGILYENNSRELLEICIHSVVVQMNSFDKDEENCDSFNDDEDNSDNESKCNNIRQKLECIFKNNK